MLQRESTSKIYLFKTKWKKEVVHTKKNKSISFIYAPSGMFVCANVRQFPLRTFI